MTGIEIERKYNVINDDWINIPPKSVQQITQGFIHHACNLVVRVRLISNDFKTTDRAYCTTKIRDSKEFCVELENDIDVDTAFNLLEKCNGHVNRKIRTTIIIDGIEWEIDQYDDYEKVSSDLEVSQFSDFDNIVLPSFIGERYDGLSNFQLARVNASNLIDGWWK